MASKKFLYPAYMPLYLDECNRQPNFATQLPTPIINNQHPYVQYLQRIVLPNLDRKQLEDLLVNGLAKSPQFLGEIMSDIGQAAACISYSTLITFSNPLPALALLHIQYLHRILLPNLDRRQLEDLLVRGLAISPPFLEEAMAGIGQSTQSTQSTTSSLNYSSPLDTFSNQLPSLGSLYSRDIGSLPALGLPITPCAECRISNRLCHHM